jgi:hypothetical protein
MRESRTLHWQASRTPKAWIPAFAGMTIRANVDMQEIPVVPASLQAR